MPKRPSDDQVWPAEQDFKTFEEYALACSVWMKRHPSAYLSRCKEGEPILFFDDMEARNPGHVYSDWGVTNYKETGLCEWHAEQAAPEPVEIDRDAFLRDIESQFGSSDPSSSSKSPQIASSGDSVSGDSETPDPFQDDDPNKPEPM